MSLGVRVYLETHFKDLQDKAGTIIGKKPSWEKHTANYLNQIIHFHKKKVRGEDNKPTGETRYEVEFVKCKTNPELLDQRRTIMVTKENESPEWFGLPELRGGAFELETNRNTCTTTLPRVARKTTSIFPTRPCIVCNGTGEVITESPLRNYEGECVDVEFINEPCDCVFQKWVAKPDPRCSAMQRHRRGSRTFDSSRHEGRIHRIPRLYLFAIRQGDD